MSNMTVLSSRPRCPENVGQPNGGPLLMNGDKKIDGPLLRNLTLIQSLNGCAWQIQNAIDVTNSTPDTNHLPNENHHIELIPNVPSTSNSLHNGTNRRDMPVSKDVHIRQGSGDAPSSADRISNGGLSNDIYGFDRHSKEGLSNTWSSTLDRPSNRLDSCATAASSNNHSSEQDDWGFMFKTHSSSHHSPVIDLKRNPLYSPKINNEKRAAAAGSYFKGVSNCKSRSISRSVSINETDLDSVNLDGSRMPRAKQSLKKIYENIGEVLKPKGGSRKSSSAENMVTHNDFVASENDGGNGRLSVTSGKTLDSEIFDANDIGIVEKRSQSLSELRLCDEQNENELDSPSSSNSESRNSDVDGDDFGFLSHSNVHFSPVMQRAKSTLAARRILPKRWRSKPRNLTHCQCTWSPEGNCIWSNANGQKITLKPISILQLSEAERLALQKIVLQKIQLFDLGCSVTVPEEHRESGKRKYLLKIKRSKSTNLSDLIHSVADKEKYKDQHSSGCVFGRPLRKCITDDMELERRRNAGTGPFAEINSSSDVILVPQSNRKSSSSSQGCLENCTQNGSAFVESLKRNVSTDSISGSESSRNTSSSQVDTGFLSDNRSDALTQSSVPMHATGPAQVPRIVKVCFQHIETYGLRVLGIFRIGSSKKRTKVLRDEFDSGRDVQLNESHNPHEVGAVLKEYFRDLPEPLLTRDLYSPLIAARGLPDKGKQNEVIQMLISLLPVANRDTLWALLHFLYKVKEHSTDAVDVNGQSLPGNKMDSFNLATLFGPNILHKAKVSEKGFTVESVERAGERQEVIDVVNALIDHHQMYFQLPAAVHDAVLQFLFKTDPATTEGVLQRMLSANGTESELPEPDTSIIQYDGSAKSLEISIGSESNSSMTNINSLALHRQMTSAKSAETLTQTSRRKCFHSSVDETGKEINRHESNVNDVTESQNIHLVIENSQSSPPDVRENPRRIKRTGVTRDSSGQELLRSHSFHNEPFQAQTQLNCTLSTLAIPQAEFVRTSSNLKKFNKPSSRTESFGLSNSGSSKVTSSQNTTSSVMRPLNLNKPPTEFENEWLKHRWHQVDE